MDYESGVIFVDFKNMLVYISARIFGQKNRESYYDCVCDELMWEGINSV